MKLATVAPEIQRDRWDRPLILPKGKSNPVAYTRTTTFVSAVEDQFGIQQWAQRNVAQALVDDGTLFLEASAARDDKKKLNAVCNRIQEAAKEAARVGTALHSLTEQVDRGEKANVPEAWRPHIAAYVAETAPLKPVWIEQMVVHDPWKVAGTPDRIVTYQGKKYIADLKTGDIELGAGKIAAQLAMYARSELYDPATGWHGIHGAETDKGLVLHLPAKPGYGEDPETWVPRCTVLWIDLLAGWEIARTCREVRERRGYKAVDLYAPFTVPPLVHVPDLVAEIRACTTADMVRQVWAVYESQWTDELTATARQHIATLPA